jgi:MFS family permease
MSLLFIFSLFLQQVQGYSAVAAGMCFLPLNAAFVIACVASGWFAARLGSRFTILMALTLASVTTISFMRITADTEYGTILFPLVLSGFGGGLALATLSAIAMNSAPLSEVGIVSAVVNVSPSLGNLLGIAIQGTILSHV